MGLYNFEASDAERFAKHVGIPARKHRGELIFKKCPYCGNFSKDKEKFSINLETGQFHCFRAKCNAKGNMITLHKDFNFSLGSEIDEYLRFKGRFRSFPQRENPTTRPEAVVYMESRGISEKVTESYHITVQRDHANILVFPFYDEKGTLMFVKYRKTDFDKEKDKNKEWCEKDGTTILFGMDHCNSINDTLVITEGQIDSLSLVEAGIENAVSVPTGADGFTWVPHCWDFLMQFNTIIVFGDHEKGRITLLDELYHRFEGSVKHIRPEDYKGCKDANEILQKYGKEALITAVGNAIPKAHPGIISMADIEKVDLSTRERFTSGLRSLDRILGGFYFGQLIVLTGERGDGKSTLASQFGTIALREGYNIFMYSGELPNFQLREWFDRQVVGAKHINRIVSDNGHVEYSVDEAVIPAIEAWYREKTNIYDTETKDESVDEREFLLELMDTAIKQNGCRVLIIDNLMTAMMDDLAIELYRQQTIFINKLVTMAKQRKVVIFLVAHPRKRQLGFSAFSNDDVSGSSNITNLAHVTLRYSKPDGMQDTDTEERVLAVLKNRTSGETNYEGIPLYFEPSSKRISEDPDDFSWELGWENLYRETETSSPIVDMELPFD